VNRPTHGPYPSVAKGKIMIRTLLRLALTLSLMSATAYAETREYSLTIARENVTINGKTDKKITLNGTLPGPVLRFTKGDEAVIHVTNTMKENSSVHWHGLLLPPLMDGAPGFNGFEAIKPGQTFTYRFPIRQSGTYWYHAHTMGQEQDGLYAGMVITPKAPDPVKADRDYVVLLSDYTREDAGTILKNLKQSADHYQNHRRTVFDFFKDVKRDGLSKATKSAGEWGQMRMLPTDLSDVTGYAFLMNGLTPDQNWTGLFKPGERVRLRFINAAAMTIYDIRVPGLKMTVVAADGQNIEPIAVDELRFGNAETYDVIVEPINEGPYQIVAESLDREGFALGTLATHEGAPLPAPPHRPRSTLTMADMNMNEMMKADPDMDMSTMPMSGWAQTGAPERAKVLSYADLKSLAPQTDTREPARDITVRLGGNMDRYVWTINGKVFDPMQGIKVAFDERVRITYINETMMAHPVHLHGMYTQLENGQDAAHMPSKHTIIVPPGQSVSAILSANEPGNWPLHCHLLFHMASGMMTSFIVAQPGEAADAPASAPVEGGHHAHH
jgi:FtsP/CotA-like multicopper oxidase with cupredoxin domain